MRLGGDAAGDFQPGWKFSGQAGRVDGISVHRAVIETRQRGIRLDGLGQNPAGHRGQIDPFRLGDGLRLRQAGGERLLHRNEIPVCRGRRTRRSCVCSSPGILPPPGLFDGSAFPV